MSLSPYSFHWTQLSALVVGFGLSSLVATAIYGLARVRALWMLCIHSLLCVLVVLICCGVIVVLMVNGLAVYAGSAFVAALLICVIQGALERARKPLDMSWKRQFTRALWSFLYSAIIGVLIVVLANSFFRGEFISRPIMGLAAFIQWQKQSAILVSAFDCGYGVGGVFAPLSLSFFRWMLSSIQLRPGVDRHLEEGERCMNPEVAS